MAQRDLDFSPQVTNVTPQLPQDGALTAGMEVMDQIANSSAAAKALSASMQTSLAFRQLDQQYRQTAASNPNDPQALSNLQSQRASVITEMGKNVPSIAMRDYQQHAIELQKASDVSNTFWGTRQMVSNTKADIQTGYKSGIDQGAMDGEQFAKSGSPATEIEGALHFAQLHQQMLKFSTPILGADKAAQLTKNFDSDYTKSFVARVAETNPQMADALLQQPSIGQHFTPQDIDDMGAVIRRTQRNQQLIKSGQITMNDAGLTEVVNDPESTYFEKRAKIDKLDMEGAVSPKAASAARRVIKSSNDLDSQTDTPVMASIINKAYDLNASAAMDADGYLVGVRNIQHEVLTAQADGQLTAPDAKKLSSQLTNLTNAKLSAATQTAGMEFYDANQVFNSLPPESRGQATRALFYAGYGQKWTPAQYKTQANTIVDQINTSRRQQANDMVNSLLPSNDAEFLKTVPNASASSIAATAKKYGITEQEVIQQLRINQVNKLRAAKQGVKRSAAGAENGEEPDSGGIRLKGPAPEEDEGIGNDDNEER